MQADPSGDARSIAALRAALEAGYTHVDTAEMYAAGHAEELVARAIREAGVEHEALFITSKVWRTHLGYADVLKACENSLRRLDREYIDLYLIHSPGDTPLTETFRALNELQAAGKIRHIGVSNFDLDLLKQSQALCASPIATNQVPYSLHSQSYVDNGVLAHCQAEDMLLTAYTPLEKGKIGEDSKLQSVAKAHAASPMQVALAWLIQQPQVIAIPMSLNPTHIAQNLAAADLQLSDAEMSLLNER
jgi:diketogulonate reductase-like aldo/keto reductase